MQCAVPRKQFGPAAQQVEIIVSTYSYLDAAAWTSSMSPVIRHLWEVPT